MDNIKTYYEKLAPDYDQSRFDNSYGRFIHQQETDILKEWIGELNNRQILDMACGTGRHLLFATHGLDQSPSMIVEAQRKFPDKTLLVGDALHIPLEDESFDLIFSFHFFMHLPKEQMAEVLQEAHRLLRPGGRFIFDFPNALRRKAFRRKPTGWHGGHALSKKDLESLQSDQWTPLAARGILALPIHRFPSGWRSSVHQLDSLLCRSFLRPFCSYQAVEWIKR